MGCWHEAVEAVEKRVVNNESGNAMLLMEFIRDADIDSNMGARCIRRLFDKELDSFDGIETLREEAVETFMKNIPAYGNEDYCLKQLAVSLSPEAQKKYGFEIKAIERENEDQYGRFTERIEIITYKGRQLYNPAANPNSR